MAIEKVNSSPAMQIIQSTNQEAKVGSFKDTRNRALQVINLAAKNCSDHATSYYTRSRESLQKMQEASTTQSGQLSFEGKLLTVLTIGFGIAGITGATINPSGANAQLLKTVKDVSETVGKSLQPVTSAIDTTCKASQEPTKTKQTIAQNGIHEANAIEGKMDQEERTTQSTADRIIETSAYKV